MTRVAILDDYQRVARQIVDRAAALPGVEVSAFADHLVDEDAVAARLADFDVVVAMRERTPFRRSLLARLPRLRLLVKTGMRNAAIDLAAAAELGITVCGTAGSGNSTVELTWALILSLVRHVPSEDAPIRAGGWQRTVGTDLAGAALGVCSVSPTC
jgi:phosphoglycerate dehydrogenase-like enzyme